MDTSSFNIWFQAIRPKTLFAGIAPVILGSAIAIAHLDLPAQNGLLLALIILCIFACTIALQIATNLVNDYYDFIDGIDNQDRLGPQRAIHQQTLTPLAIKKGFISCFLFAAFISLFLIYRGGMVIAIIALSSVFFAYAYTAHPFRLSRFCLGEVLAFIFFGPVAVWGTTYLILGTHSWDALLLGMGPGFISAALMAINNLRDYQSDRQARKWTLASVFGEKFGRFTVMSFTACSVLLPLVYAIASAQFFILITLISLLFFIKNAAAIINDPIDQNFNLHLQSCGRYIFIYCLLLSVGYYLGHV